MRTVILLCTALAAVPAAAQRPLKIVTSLPTYAAIAREVVGDRGTVTAIGQGDEEPHFVQPKPSFVPMLGSADLFVTTGLDLELWVPALLDKAGNPRVSEGGPGYVAAYAGVLLLEVPTSVSRAQGDIHVYGNPHLHTDPINAIIIARNIAAGLARVAPQDSGAFAERERDFERRVLVALYGEDLVRILTPEGLMRLARDRGEWDFFQRNRYQGQPPIRVAARARDGLLPQGMGVFLGALRPALRGLHRAQAGHPAVAAPRAGGRGADAHQAHPGRVLAQLLRPPPGA